MPAERIAPELTERIALDQLTYLRGNPRRGDLATIREVLTTLGQAEAIVVNRGTHTGVPNEIVGGNNRVRVMRELGWTEVAITWVDVPDDVTLRKLAVALNRAGDKATYDDRALADLMAAIAGESDLTGTGYDEQAYQDLMRATDVFGDAAAGFLSNLTDSEDDPFPDEPPPSTARPAAPAAGPTPVPGSGEAGGGAADREPLVSNGYVTASWTVLPEQRDTIRDALRKAQSKWQTGTAAEALVELCDRFLKETA